MENSLEVSDIIEEGRKKARTLHLSLEGKREENKSHFVDTDNLFPGSFYQRLLNRE